MSFTQDPHDNKILQLCRDGKVAEAIKLHKELVGIEVTNSNNQIVYKNINSDIKAISAPTERKDHLYYYYIIINILYTD